MAAIETEPLTSSAEASVDTFEDSPHHDPGADGHAAAWKTFTSYWAGSTLSAIGDYFTLIALPIAALQLTGSGLWVAAVEFAELTAVLLMGMWLAGIADRRHARPVMATAATCRGVIVGALAAWFALGTPPIASLVAAGFMLGALRHLHLGAENVMISAVVPDHLIDRAGSRLELSEGVGNFTGALIGGTVASISVAVAFGIDAATFAVALVAIIVMGHFVIDRGESTGSADPVDSADSTGSTDAPRGSVAVGLAALREEDRYWRMMVPTAITTLASVCLIGQWVTLARRELGLSGWQIGLGMALVGAGNIVGSIGCGRFGWISPRSLFFGLVAFASGPLVIGLTGNAVVAMFAMFGSGVGVAIAAIVLQTHRNSAFDTSVQARVYSIHRITIDSLVLPGVLLGGMLADDIGSSKMFVLFGSFALAGPVLAILLGGTRRMAEPNETGPNETGTDETETDESETDSDASGPVELEPEVDLRQIRTPTASYPSARTDPMESATSASVPHQLHEDDVYAAIAEGLRNLLAD